MFCLKEYFNWRVTDKLDKLNIQQIYKNGCTLL